MTKHSRNHELASDARFFLDALADTHSGDRLVLPGVDTRTTYRAAYCAPNSLALVLRYWGIGVSSHRIGREITIPDVGTLPTEVIRFAVSQGLKAHLLPYAETADLESWLEAQVPVLAITPGHIRAVVGHDPVLQTWITYDTARWDLWAEEPKRSFKNEWIRMHGAVVVMTPGDDEEHDLLEEEQVALARSELWRQVARRYELRDPRETSLGMSALALAPDNLHAYLDLWRRHPRLRTELEAHGQEHGDALAARAQSWVMTNGEGLVDDIQLLESLGREDELTRILDRATSTAGRLETPAKLEAGRAYLRLGRCTEALGLLQSAHEQLDLDDERREDLRVAKCLEDSESFPQALDAYRSCIESGSYSFHEQRLAARGVVRLCRRLDRSSQAVVLLARHLSRDPSDARAWTDYADFLEATLAEGEDDLPNRHPGAPTWEELVDLARHRAAIFASPPSPSPGPSQHLDEEPAKGSSERPHGNG